MSKEMINICNVKTEQIKSLTASQGFSSIKLRNGDLAISDSGGLISIVGVYDNKETKVLKVHSKSIVTLVQLFDGQLTSDSWDKTVKLWNPKTGLCNQILEGHTGKLMAIYMFNNGEFGSCGDEMIIWKLIKVLID